jgi:hypothetical protein
MLPVVTMSLPGRDLSLSISSRRGPLSTVVFCHSGSCREPETTYLETRFR